MECRGSCDSLSVSCASADWWTAGSCRVCLARQCNLVTENGFFRRRNQSIARPSDGEMFQRGHDRFAFAMSCVASWSQLNKMQMFMSAAARTGRRIVDILCSGVHEWNFEWQKSLSSRTRSWNEDDVRRLSCSGEVRTSTSVYSMARKQQLPPSEDELSVRAFIMKPLEVSQRKQQGFSFDWCLYFSRYCNHSYLMLYGDRIKIFTRLFRWHRSTPMAIDINRLVSISIQFLYSSVGCFALEKPIGVSSASILSVLDASREETLMTWKSMQTPIACHLLIRQCQLCLIHLHLHECKTFLPVIKLYKLARTRFRLVTSCLIVFLLWKPRGRFFSSRKCSTNWTLIVQDK